jgi:DNA polymerase III alpha subunit
LIVCYTNSKTARALPADSARHRPAFVDHNGRKRTLTGFPRHITQHVGGFVMARGRLDELDPIENAAMEDRTVIQWDKDDLDALRQDSATV